MQEVGEGCAEMYRSSKWQKDDDYKHVPGLEGGTRTAYVVPGFLREWGQPAKRIKISGPMVELEAPMPRHFTRLGPLLGVQLHLYAEDESGALVLPKGAGFMEVRMARGELGAAEHPATKETFLFVYSTEGVHMLLTGPKLEIEKDGIAG